MSKKVFTFLLVAVFALAQFSMASAAPIAGAEGTLTGPDFMPAGALSTVKIDWTATGLTNPTNIVMYARPQGGTYVLDECLLVATINGTSTGSGTFTYDFGASVNAGAPADGDYWEFTLVFDSTDTCGVSAPANPADVDNFLASSYVDGNDLDGNGFIPPADGVVVTPPLVACNTFEYWALGSDSVGLVVPTDPYSGFGSWNQQITGTFAPAPIGPEDALLEWDYTFPATATGPWQFSIDPEDAAGNVNGGGPFFFRNTVASPTAAELADCATFSDISGHADELYVRYLATLGLISGFADGTFGPDTTLTRAEASTLIEISNGYDGTNLPPAAPSAACTFTDVAATDWFAGWVWQACDDGYMNGIGGGLFDPNNLLTRGQIVTILNNIVESGTPPHGGFLAAGPMLWTAFFDPVLELRNAPWSDVSVGAFYAEPVQEAYGWGIADGTSATTFSPDEPVTRGEFAKMLYRALSWFAFGF